MSNFPTIRNPLLPSPPISSSRSRFRKSDLFSNLSLSTTATLSSSISTASIRSFMSQTMNQISNASATFRIGQSRRIMPSTGMPKSVTDQVIGIKHYVDSHRKAKNQEAEPLVYYNGPCHTLESLPAEKLNWIKDEQTSALVKNPLTNYNKSIVLRKPLTRSQTYPVMPVSSRALAKPKGMFYLRVLQVIATDTSKTRLFRCGVQLNQETYLSSYVTSEKTGKSSSIAQFDETFLFDIDDQATVTISIYAQNKGGSFFSSRSQKQEEYLGKESIQVSLHPKSKTTERFVLNSDPHQGQSNDFQLLVVHGTFLSKRTQNMLNNTVLFEDFITVYVHTGMVPRWDRFWGLLRGVQFELYDFEYKENRPPLYIIPLDNFISAFDPSEQDGEEIRIDIGARGIALQFTENAIHRTERDWITEDMECRMYLLPESSAAAREWENKFNYVASIFDEVRGWDSNDSDSSSYSYDYSDEEEEDSIDEAEGEYVQDGKPAVPLKLMW